jgi:hypothetical protein
MKNIFLLILAVMIGFMVACDHHDTLPPYTATTIFNVSSKMWHNKDTIKSAGDTIMITARGGVYDTSKKYGISASLKAVDSVTANLYSVAYIKSITVHFDTTGYAATNLYRWTSTMTLPISTIPAKSKIKASAVFTFGLNLSSQMGNQNGADTAYIYAK